MLEKEIEKKFKNKVEKYGAKVLKFVSPGKAGVPDRIILLPKGRCVFAEIKAPGEQPRKLQIHVMKEIKKLGFGTWLIDSVKKIDDFCNYYFEDGGTDA